ncbi:MAG: hypothetical protein AAB368_01615, partial [bacterium]
MTQVSTPAYPGTVKITVTFNKTMSRNLWWPSGSNGGGSWSTATPIIRIDPQGLDRGAAMVDAVVDTNTLNASMYLSVSADCNITGDSSNIDGHATIIIGSEPWGTNHPECYRTIDLA